MTYSRLIHDNDKRYVIPQDSIRYGDGPNLDAFGRLRISDIFTLFDSKSLNEFSDIFYTTEISGGSIQFQNDQSSRILSVTGGTDSYAIIQTKRSFNYLAGKGQYSILTGVLSIEEGVIKRVGIFDSSTTAPYIPKNGIYFETDGQAASVNLVNNTNDLTKIRQNLWNLDTFDGNGGSRNPSGIRLDLTKTQIFVIDFEWLGVGRVRYGFNIDGKTFYCHEILNANNKETVYMAYPNLPIRYEIRSQGGDGSMRQICAMISSEGGFQPNGIIREINNVTGLTIGAGVTRPILAIRLKDISKFIEIVPTVLSVFAADEGDFIWNLKFFEGNETISRNSTPTQWNNITFDSLSKSNVEYKRNFLTTDTIITGQGIDISGGIVSAVAGVGNSSGGGSFTLGDVKNALLLGSKLNGDRDVLCITVRNISSVSDSYYSSISWRELQ